MTRAEIKKLFGKLLPEAYKQANEILKEGSNRDKIMLINSLLDRLDLPKTKSVNVTGNRLNIKGLSALRARRDEIIFEREKLIDGGNGGKSDVPPAIEI